MSIYGPPTVDQIHDQPEPWWRWACEYGHLPTIETLLAMPDFDPTFWCNTGVRTAMKAHQQDAVDLLLRDPRIKAYEDRVQANRQQKINP